MALFHFPSPRSPVSWANNLLSFFFSSWQQRLRRRYLFPWSLPSDQRPSIFPFSLSLSLGCGSPPSSVFRLPPSSRSHFCTTPFFADIVIIFLFFLLCQKGNRVLGNRVHSHRKTGGGECGGFDRSLSQPFSLFFSCNGRRLPRILKYPKSPFSTFGGKGSECCGLNHHHAVLWGVERGLKALQRGVWGGKKKRGVEGNQDSPLFPSSPPIHSTLRHKETSRGEEGTFQAQDST